MSSPSPEALRKARAITHMFCLFPPSDKQALEIQIATALQAERDAAAPKLPDDLAGLVEPLSMSMFIRQHDMIARLLLDRRRVATAIQSLVARNAELEAGLRGLLDCPDIADNDYNDEETHAAERVARSLLNKDRQP